MGNIKFTAEQNTVIEARNCNLLVSAAAGSGKTAVLVERILQRIQDETDPVSLDRLLVMTFTRAAAEGMRQKIYEALNRKIAETERELGQLAEDSEEYSTVYGRWTGLRSQAALLPRARISTIDSICQGLIRQYFQYLEIDPAFRVADEAELKLMKYDLLKDLLEETYETGEDDFLKFSTAFSGTGLDGKLSALILDAYEFAQAKPWPEEFLKTCDREAEKELAGNVWETDWFALALREVREKTGYYLEELNKGKALCMEPDGWKPYQEMFLGLEAFYGELTSALWLTDPKKTYEAVRWVLLAYEKPVLSRKGCKEADPEKKEKARILAEEVRSWPVRLMEGYFSQEALQWERSAAKSAEDIRVLIRLTVEFMSRFEEKKRLRGVVDFGDMEHFALKLLYAEEDGRDGQRSFTSLADELAGSFDEILIDEYQDSNEVQEELIRALSAERFGRPDIFMVGDVKQSIYSFRQAKPGLFMEKYRTYSGAGEGGDKLRIELNRNFRSRPEVLDTVNDIFREVMKPSCGGILYDDAAALYPGRSDCPEAETGELLRSAENKTELWLVEEKEPEEPGKKEQGQEENGEKNSFSEDEAEFVMLAERIRELTGPENRPQPWKKKEITVLMRNSKKAEKLVDVLEQFGIDACFDSSAGYFASREVSLMLAYLGIIDNPRQEIALVTVLKSPFAGFTDTELAKIRYRYGQPENGRKTEFFDALTHCAEAEETSLSQKAAAFLQKLLEYRSRAGFLPVHELIHRIYTETGFYEYAAALPGGLRRRRNLDLLLEKAENYSATSYHGLFNFIRYIDQLKSYETDYGEAAGIAGTEDMVHITTIHKSKGLEYPVTFIAGMGGRFNLRDSGANLVMDEQLGFACDYIDTEQRIRYPSLKAKVIRERKRTEQIGEELRVLYVAMTRAREKLIMTGTVSGFEEKKQKERQKAGDIAGCISYQQILLKSGITEKESLRVCLVQQKALLTADPVRKAPEKKTDLRQLLKEASVPLEELEEYRKRLTAVYPRQEETKLKPKVSVSELKARVIKITEDDFVRDLEENRQTKGAAYGTIIHRAFELLDYGKEGKEALPDLPGADEKTMVSVRKTIEDFRKTELAEDMKQAFLSGRLYREQHFMLGMPAAKLTPGASSEELQLMQGIIDAYILTPEGIRLIDYKTDHVDSEEKLVSRYALQLELYAQALEQLLRKPVTERLIYSTFLKRTIMI